ncbi:DUF3078 domain-containing protein [Echinicola pacifica]|nr:DUF3078 domain-containing protein [Echinicola pacifica]
MKKFLSVLAVITMLSHMAIAQDTQGVDPAVVVKDTTYWVKEFAAGLNFNQAAFSSNWSNGGVNSIAIGSILSGSADYAKDRWSWDNEVELLYGMVKNDGEDGRKSNDRIFLDSKVGYKLTQKWGAYFSGNFLSQFANGYDFDTEPRTLISSFMSPGYLTTSLGLEYNPNDEFNLRIGPFSPRWTFVTNDEVSANVPNNYGVPIGENVRTEWLALQIFAEWDKDIAENFNIKTRYQMYADYQDLSFKTIDHRLDITMTAKITEIISVTFTSINVYDIDQDPGIQYSQGLALGLLYKVSNKK